MGVGNYLKSLKTSVMNRLFLLYFNIDRFPEAVIIYDSKCQVLKYNKSAAKMFSHSLPTKGKTFCQVSKCLPKACHICINKRSANEKYLYHEIVKYNIYDKNVGYLKFTYFPVRDLTVCYIRDYTEKRKEEEKKSHEPIEILSKGIAHDFNNIFQIIIGYLSFVDSSSQSYLEEIKKMATKGANLVQKILFFSDIETGNAREYLDFSKELRSILGEISPFYQPAIDIIKSIDGGVFALANKEQIKQLLVFIINYVKSVTANSQGIIDISLIKEKGHTCRLKIVKDGIVEHDVDKIFDPYFGLDPRNFHHYTNNNYSGFDLAISFKIIEKHEGTVNVLYGENKIEVNISLPTVKEIKRTKVMRLKKIALVDDEIPLLNLIQMGARSFGYKVDTFSSEEEFFNKVVKSYGDYSILVVDQNMPQVLGVDLVRRLRDQGIKNPVILCSGFTELSLTDMKELKIEDLLMKPFTIYQFIYHIQKIED